LIDEVKQQLLLHRRGNVFLRACKRYFQSWHTYALLLCLSLLVASFVLLILDAYLSSRIIIEMAVLVLAFITNFLWVYFRTRRDLLARTVRIEAHLQYFASNSDPLLEQDFHNLFTRSSIESTITVRRNGEWIKVPMNLVAAGDTRRFLAARQAGAACALHRSAPTGHTDGVLSEVGSLHMFMHLLFFLSFFLLLLLISCQTFPIIS
jgi:hypothetical protein